jgi:hypothetical protein
MLCATMASDSTATGPLRHQLLEQRREFASVDGDMPAAVVVQEQCGIAEFAGKRFQPIPLAPLQVVHAQAVHHHHQLGFGLGDGRGQRLARQFQWLAVAPQSHGNRQRVAGFREIVAKHAVHRCQHRLAAERRTHVVRRWHQAAECLVEHVSDAGGDRSDAAIDQPGDAARRFGRCRTPRARQVGNADVHGFYDVGDPDDGIDHQTTGAANVGRMEVVVAHAGGDGAGRCCR